MKLLSIDQAAEYLGLSKSTLYKKTSAKSIPFLKLGSRVLFDQDVLRRWAEARFVQPIGESADLYLGRQDHETVA